MDEEVKLKEEIIPLNFVGSGRIFNGLFKQVNLIEGIIMALPGFWLSMFKIEWNSFNTKFYGVLFLVGLPLALGIAGINDEDILSFIMNVLAFRKSKRVAKYNPRAKAEITPEYIYNSYNELPRDKMISFINKVLRRENGDYDDLSADITSDAYKTYFIDDVDVAGKYGAPELPTELKSKKEQRAEAKKKKAEEKKRLMQEKKEQHELERLRKKQAKEER